MSEGNGISNRPGPASAAEPSMEEILASIRRILSEEEARPAAQAPAAFAPAAFDDEEVLVLDASMRVAPELEVSATLPPQPESASNGGSLESGHFSSGPGLDSHDERSALDQGFVPASLIEPLPISTPPEPLAQDAAPDGESGFAPAPQFAPQPVFETHFEPAPSHPPAEFTQSFEPAPSFAPAPAVDHGFVPPPEPVPYATPAFVPSPEPYQPASFAAPDPAFTPPPAPQEENPMHDNHLQSPDGLVSDEAVSEIANSFGTLVRSVSAERAASIGRPGVTIEDIVREEVKPVLKAWLDTHLPSMVERMVRAEINRVLERAKD